MAIPMIALLLAAWIKVRQTPKVDGRVKLRVTSEIRAEIEIGGKPHEFGIENISETGILLRTELRDQLQIGQIYELRLHVPKYEPIQTSVIVVRHTKHGVGVTFEEAKPEAKALIRKHVNSRSVEELPSA
jgi:hypothetical protein